jgi:hypothetical protein
VTHKLQAARKLHATVCTKSWVEHGVPQPLRRSGVYVKSSNGEYVVEPKMADRNILTAIQQIRAQVVLVIVTDDTEAVFDALQADKPLELQDSSPIQNFESLEVLAWSTSIKKFQHAALVCQERLLLVWYHNLDAVVEQATYIHSKIHDLVATLGHDTSEDYESTLWSYVSSKIADAKELQEESGAATQSVDLRESETLSRPAVYTSAIFTAMAVFLRAYSYLALEPVPSSGKSTKTASTLVVFWSS